MAAGAGDAYKNGQESAYPLTKMNFFVSVSGVDGTAAFTEVTGVEASVDVIEFRQGNSGSLSPVKIPGLVKHGNVTLKMGYTKDEKFKEWVLECVSERRKAIPRQTVNIEMIDINEGAPSAIQKATMGTNRIWQLTNAWVTKYTAPDLNSTQSEVAIESVELAYEELIIPN